MEIIMILLPLGLFMSLGFLAAYFWAVKTGQFEDTVTPSYRVLLDEEKEKE